MQEHVGKIRRREVREAVDMRNELKSMCASTSAVFGVGVVLAVSFVVLSFFGMALGSALSRLLPTIVLAILLCIACSRAYKLSGLREEYREHCRRYNITKDDMRAFERGEL